MNLAIVNLTGRLVLGMLLALLLVVPAAHAVTMPIIERVVLTDGSLEIHGDDLDTGVPSTVKLGTAQLSVQISSASLVTADLPGGLKAGSHLVTLRRADGRTTNAQVTVGVSQRIPTASFTGLVSAVQGNSGLYVFAGPTAVVMTTRPNQRLIGAATAPLGLHPGSQPQTADVGLCTQPQAGGDITNFLLSNFTVHGFTISRASYSATATVVLPDPGAYKVGMCIRNNGPSPITNNNYVNGWVSVLD